MKRIQALIFLFSLSIPVAFGWGQNGHRIVGLIAEKHLTKKARKNIDKILRNETLAEVSNYMDFIKADATFDHMKPWHYCTIPEGKTYEEAGVPEEGDAIQAIKRFTMELKTKNFSMYDESFALKCLVHLIGDIHQPLHVGNGEDRGGNDVKVTYFWENSNLHRVWDTQMIESQNYSYTEYVAWINHPTKSELEKWENDDLMTWINESSNHHEQVYDLPEDNKIAYEYIYKNRSLLNQRLLQAGVRLASVLNEIYG